ncbi:MarR family winged helix-turn-helix transcriptional regulator [Agromyces aerolatus]|uniref:MarR family winged helix-turn-helix transcriptional regulator n=1 Tax=Agromyces sp. LY-1074 TaxID=3074080 RepID=UPI0028602DDC|nr:MULTISPECIES: MarR family transcriptional regulator [unclassified Agromyces]MDR5701517.1 MarR family transcriptional regulator [Agromyces sp. LY-1074]MDR5707876.1 MarR family transcriptional regulator [Agromyces sp. LY-1358]
MVDMGEHRVRVADAMHDPRIVDPDEELVVRAGMSDDDVTQAVRVMESLRGWHDAAARMSEASERYMRLNHTDMRAIRFLIAARNQGAIATPGALAAYLGISSAATTKLLDRLERGGHIERGLHPTDRRAIALTVTEHTRHDARETVGRQHARRFAVAAALTPADREVVIRFLDALAATGAAAAPPVE